MGKKTHNPLFGKSNNAKQAEKSIDIHSKEFEPVKPESSDKTKPKTEPKEKPGPKPGK